ncbi:MAG TPA: helix-turn-helix domain-containing protein [Propionibacteriaceae bacterium]
MTRWTLSGAAELYAQGWTLRQIGAELGVTETTVSYQLRRAGVTMRRGGPPAFPASTDQIVELRDQGLTWNEIAEQVDMTVSGVWSRYRKARPPKPQRLGRWQQVLADVLEENLAMGLWRQDVVYSHGWRLHHLLANARRFQRASLPVRIHGGLCATRCILCRSRSQTD